MDMARCIGLGRKYFDHETIKTPVVYIDFENPLAVLNNRTKKLGSADNVYFWRVNSEKIKAPKIDTDKWEIYKTLPENSVLIFDTLRSAHRGNENESDKIVPIMEHLKELRDRHFTVIILHHTPKNIGKGCLNCTCFILRCGLWVLLGVSSVTRSAFKPQLVCLISILFEVFILEYRVTDLN